MTLLEHLQAHRGGLIKLKTELYWYGARGYDGSPGRICLLLDSAATDTPGLPGEARTGTAARSRTAAQLLIDGSPQWVWVFEADVELI